MPAGFSKAGWYRLTFSLDGTQADLACSDFDLNTSVRDASILVSEEEGAEAAAAEEEPVRPHFDPIVDAANNLTYVDVYVEDRGGSSGPGRAIRGRGKGRVPGVGGSR